MCPELGSYIRYGAADPRALILMTSGIRSRRLAHAIIADLPADLEPTRETLRLWMARMGVPEWRTRYHASASEVVDLLDFTRVRSRSLLKTLLETGTVSVELPAMSSNLPAWNGPLTLGPLTLEPLHGEPQLSPLAIYAGDQHIITVAAQDHTDLSAVLDTGLAITVEIDRQTDRPTLSITLPFADTGD
jgi:hypothetical protein